MNTNIIVKQGFAYLKDYKFYLVTDRDISQIRDGVFKEELKPLPLINNHFMFCGLKKCHDNFGRGDYFNLMGINIWWSNSRIAYYYTRRKFTYNMRFFHEFQYFLETYLHFEVNDFTEISLYVNNYYLDPRNRFSLLFYYLYVGIDPASSFIYQCEIPNEYF